MDDRRYKVTYSRLMASGRYRLVAHIEKMSEHNLKSLFMDTESRYKYIVISCELINPDMNMLNSLSQNRSDES